MVCSGLQELIKLACTIAKSKGVSPLHLGPRTSQHLQCDCCAFSHMVVASPSPYGQMKWRCPSRRPRQPPFPTLASCCPTRSRSALLCCSSSTGAYPTPARRAILAKLTLLTLASNHRAAHTQRTEQVCMPPGPAQSRRGWPGCGAASRGPLDLPRHSRARTCTVGVCVCMCSALRISLT